MKYLTWFIIAFSIHFVSLSQPGNGNGNSNGNGNCANPPCGGPHQTVPVDAEWLLYAGLVVGIYVKFQFKRKKTTP